MVCVTEPVGVARKVPTLPVTVPLVQVTDALASTAKFVDAAEEASFALERLTAEALADPLTAADGTSLHAAASVAIATRIPAAIRRGASARIGRVE
jgi:hypothetical protein